MLQWSIAQVHQLHAQQRMDPPRDNISSGFYRYEFGTSRDENCVPAELALEHPFKGLGMTFVDFPADDHSSNDIAGSAAKALSKVLHAAMLETRCCLSLCLSPLPLPDEVPAYVPRVAHDILTRRRVLLHFFDAHPAESWRAFTDSLASQLQDHCRADIVYSAPFIPTIPGTDTYLDQL